MSTTRRIWRQDSDITETAQKVQRSGHPEAYRKHEPNARTLASTFTGWTPDRLSYLHDEIAAERGHGDRGLTDPAPRPPLDSTMDRSTLLPHNA